MLTREPGSPVLEEPGWVTPFRRAGLVQRIGAFALVAVAAEASLLLPGPPTSTDTIVSLGLLALTAGLIVLPWDKMPSWATVVVPFTYVASVMTLNLAAGGAASGVGIIILIPLIWTALYHRRWESMVVTVAIVIVELVISFDPRVNATAVIVRRVVFWGVLGLVISFSVHGLRDRLRAAFREREQLHANQAEHLRRTEALGLAAEELTAYRDPLQVVTAASRLAAQVAAPPGAGPRRAQYVRLFGHIGRRVALYDEVAGEGLGTDFPIAEHPALERAFVTGEASHGPLDPAISGPTVQAMLLSLGLTHGVYVPIMVDGVIDGVLMVALRGGAPPGDLLEQCKALGHLTELALRNALAHELLQDMATTDALTGVANRRSFEQLMTQHPGRRPYAVLVLDVDGLKAVNDTYGHLAGDRMLVEVAASLNRVMRRGDVLARVGGDEFAVFAVDADLEAGREIAERMLLALSRARIVGGAPRASIGVAVGTEGDDALEVFGAADAAMYAAKREGGERFALSASSHR